MQLGKLTWTTLLEIVGIFSIVGSIIFVGLQMKQDQEIAAAENVMLVVSERQAWTELLANNSVVWINGNSGAELTTEEALIYNQLAETLELRYFSSWFRNQRVPGGNPPQVFVYDWVADLEENPGLMEFWSGFSIQQERKYQQLGSEGALGSLWRAAVDELLAERSRDDQRSTANE